MSWRCRFCKGPVFPWNQKEGMHPRCAAAVDQMWRDDLWRWSTAYRTKEASRQRHEDAHFHDPEWQQWQAEMRWKEEDEL